MRRALIAGISAFVAVAVAGSVLVTLIQRAEADGRDRFAHPLHRHLFFATSPHGTDGRRLSRMGARRPSGGLRREDRRPTHGRQGRGGCSRRCVDDQLDSTRTATWSTNPRDPYMIPIDAAAIDQAAYARFLPPETRSVVTDLQDGQAILGQTSAKLRHLGPGGVMTFLGGASVTVIGILPDQLVGAAELVVTRATGAAIGVHQNRYVLFQPEAGLRPTVTQLENRFRALLPPDVQYPVVQVRAPGETKYLRQGDAVLPPALIKRRFGEWAGRPQPGDAGYIEIDPAWVQERIVTAELPVIGRVSCNRKLIPQLRGALEEVVAARVGVHDPRLQRLLLVPIRAAIPVGIYLPPRVGDRDRCERRHEPLRNSAHAGSSAGRDHAAVGVRDGAATGSCPTGCTSSTCIRWPPRRDPGRNIVEGSRYQAHRLHVLGSRAATRPRVLSMPPAA